MKKLIIAFILLTVLLTACSNEEVKQNQGEYTFWHVTDFHHLAPELNQNSPGFVNLLLQGDGKTTHYSYAMIQAFKDLAIKEKPDAVIVSGDLTFNGERLSHEDLSATLLEIQNAGVPVVVIPGNHDVDYPFAYAFIDNKSELTDRLSYDDYEVLYKDLGLSKAIARDEYSYSFIYEFSEDIYFLAIDTSTSANAVILDETLIWIDEALAELPENAMIISTTHQNIFMHNEGFYNGYVIDKSQELIEILNKYNVQLNLSGHMHIQSVVTQENLTEIATGAFCAYPTRYAQINYSNGNLSYTAQSVDVSAWAEENDIANEEILDFNNYSKEFFELTSYYKGLSFAQQNGFNEEESEIVADFFAQMNNYYFYGNLNEGIDILKQHEGYTLLNESSADTGLLAYINTVLNSEMNNDLIWNN